jgi:hypothetical protein
MQYGDMNIEHKNTAWTFSMDMGMQYRHGYAAWTWTYRTDMDMLYQHAARRYGHAVWTCSMDMDLQH